MTRTTGNYTRFAIYYVPPPGPLARFGASWLGWDIETGGPSDHLEFPGLPAITEKPRKYGFHATLKPPFRLASGTTESALQTAVSDLATKSAPASFPAFEVAPLGRFLALVPSGDASSVSRLAATCVTEIDHFRAHATQDDIAKRLHPRLNEAQKAHLMRWGYPHVLDQFRFHMTLTGKLRKTDMPYWRTVLETRIPKIDEPVHIEQVALVGERPDGFFEVISRHSLTG